MKLPVIFLALCIWAAEGKFVQNLRISGAAGLVTKNVQTERGGPEDNNVPEDRDIFEINADTQLHDGDIVSSNTKNTLVNEQKHWDTRSIPVAYAPDLNLEAIAAIEEARREYQIRTCLNFVDRTTEENYIYFEALGGCYSSVGMTGGAQTISIGSGCERMSTVQHEMMHALGIYHEQSRTDRNDYVTIEVDNVSPGKEHNFDTYSYLTVDDRRVPYDYNSVMHYGDTSFSSNGLPTIVTADAAFQDVIGQRRTFSEGDVTKISRMYQCSDPLLVSYSCDFEEEAVCGYVQDTADQTNWVRHDLADDLSSIVAPLPTMDSSSGEEGQGTYMAVDTTTSSKGDTAVMRTMRLKSKAPKQCLDFSYYMDLASGSAASISVHVATISSLNGDIQDLGSPVTTLTGDHETYWNTERLTISAPSEYKLVFVATTDGQSLDAIAIDDVNVQDKPCETGYFVINNYSELIASASPGDYLYSPVMYTEDGFAFQIKVYPVGSSSSTEGYMSLYYYVAMGVNDDKLKWPMSDRVIKYSVVDQGSEALTRMSQFSNLLTDTGSAWQQPTSSRNSGYGYSKFMSVSDITGTRNFMKHNSVMISIQVTDMSSWESLRAVSSKVVRPPTSFTLERDHDGDSDEFRPCEHFEDMVHDDDTVSQEMAIGIAAVSAAVVFALMTIVLFIFNCQHQKQIVGLVGSLAQVKPNSGLPDYERACHNTKAGTVNFSMQ